MPRHVSLIRNGMSAVDCTNYHVFIFYFIFNETIWKSFFSALSLLFSRGGEISSIKTKAHIT